MINLSAWNYRHLLGNNNLIEAPDCYQIELIDKNILFESNVKLKDKWRPSWLEKSSLYKDCDGSGTDSFQHTAVYKAISEALERLAFYETIDVNEKDFAFDINPTTTGMAAFPSFTSTFARNNAKLEAVERWAIHEFNKNKLPLIAHPCLIPQLEHYEIKVPFYKVNVSLLVYAHKSFYAYGFAGGQNIQNSFKKALIELDRNRRILEKNHQSTIETQTDKIIIYFSTEEGHQYFLEKVSNASNKIINEKPKIICDKEITGHWNQYTKVWRYLLEDSYYDKANSSSYFMF
jgi:hypothetical protein